MSERKPFTFQDLKQAWQALQEAGPVGPTQLRVFVDYSGWYLPHEVEYEACNVQTQLECRILTGEYVHMMQIGDDLYVSKQFSESAAFKKLIAIQR